MLLQRSPEMSVKARHFALLVGKKKEISVKRPVLHLFSLGGRKPPFYPINKQSLAKPRQGFNRNVSRGTYFTSKSSAFKSSSAEEEP